MIGRSRGRGKTLTGVTVDTFERASLGANWTSVLGNPAIVASSDFGASAFSGIHIATWTGTTPTVNQFAEAVISSGMNAQMQGQVFVRRRTSDSARYAFHYDAENLYWQIKYDGVPTESVRSLATDAVTAGYATGDTIRIEVRGTGAAVNIRGFRNGRLLLEVDDVHADRITTNGPPGLTIRAFVGASLSYPQAVFESYAVGSLL